MGCAPASGKSKYGVFRPSGTGTGLNDKIRPVGWPMCLPEEGGASWICESWIEMSNVRCMDAVAKVDHIGE